MRKEIKVRVNAVEPLLERLASMGSRMISHLHVTNVYFHQPSGHVLKISSDETGDFLVRLKSNGAGFDVVSIDVIDDVEQRRSELTAEFGEKRVLEKETFEFRLPARTYSVCINAIPDVGDFVIVEDEDPALDIFTDDLGIVEPEVISVPFDELPLIR